MGMISILKLQSACIKLIEFGRPFPLCHMNIILCSRLLVPVSLQRMSKYELGRGQSDLSHDDSTDGAAAGNRVFLFISACYHLPYI